MMCYIIGAITYWTITREVVNIKKSFYLASNYNAKKGKPAIDDLNKLLEKVGVSFCVDKVGTGQKIFIDVNEDKLNRATTLKAGRPVEHDIDYNTILKMQQNGLSNKEIYTRLNISKSLFYLKMREYKNNIGQCKGVEKHG